MKKLCLVVLALFLCSSVFGATLAEGVAAYKNKDYPAAFKIIRELAEQGDADAQNNLGNMYDQKATVSPGTTRKPRSGFAWPPSRGMLWLSTTSGSCMPMEKASPRATFRRTCGSPCHVQAEMKMLEKTVISLPRNWPLSRSRKPNAWRKRKPPRSRRRRAGRWNRDGVGEGGISLMKVFNTGRMKGQPLPGAALACPEFGAGP